MVNITGPGFLSTLDELVDKEEISFTDRKILVNDMSDILDKINRNRTATTFDVSLTIWLRRGLLYLRTVNYRRIYDKHRHLVAEETAKRPEYGTYVYNDEPSIVRYSCSGKIKTHQWWMADRLHRDNDKPASIIWHENGQLDAEEWYRYDIKHRDNDQPAYITYYESGKVKSKQWLAEGKSHRDNDKPAVINYYENGQLATEIWFEHGVRRRSKGGPSCLEYDTNGNVEWR